YDRNNLTADVERRICSTLESRERPTSAPESMREPSKKVRDERVKTDEVDPEFYKHENYNLDNLYKNRLHQAQPVRNKNESGNEEVKEVTSQTAGTVRKVHTQETGIIIATWMKRRGGK